MHGRSRRFWVGATLLGGLGGLAAGLWPALGQPVSQQYQNDSFSGPDVAWVRGEAGGRFVERQHRLDDLYRRSDPTSETIQYELPADQTVDYSYVTLPAPVGEDFTAGLFARADRSAVQLFARVVLPAVTDPQRPGQPLTTLVPGDVYELRGSWQRLEMTRFTKALAAQQALLRAQFQRDVPLDGAYVDRLVLRLGGGDGVCKVWIDDLKVGPVRDGRAPVAPRAPGVAPQLPDAPPPAATAGRPTVELRGSNLWVGGKRFFPRGIRYTGMPMPVLRDAGVNTVFFDRDAPPGVLEEAANQRLWLVPRLNLGTDRLTSAALGPDDDAEFVRLGGAVGRYPAGDAVLFWNLGEGLGANQIGRLARAAEVVRTADPQRPRTADVADTIHNYSRRLDALGTHRFPLYTGLGLNQYRDLLVQRRNFADPGKFFWTWVQAHRPAWYRDLLRGPDGAEPETSADPAQVRLLTYLAIAAGCRGISYWVEDEADPKRDRELMLTLAILNQELAMLEPLLVSLEGAPTWVDTSPPSSVKAAVLRCNKAILVLPMWLDGGGQYVPGQYTQSRLKVRIPQVPESLSAWEVSPGDVRQLPVDREVGGVTFTLEEFDMTRAVVFTGDSASPAGLVVGWENLSKQLAKPAAQWTAQLAALELARAEKVEAELAQLAPRLPGMDQLIADGHARLERTRYLFEAQDYREAYREARRATRPVRHLMRLRWQQAASSLGPDGASASPYAISFETLPRHWQLHRLIQSGTFGRNVLDGGFEGAPTWSASPATADNVVMDARVIAEKAREGDQCLRLKVEVRKTVPGQQPPPPTAYLEHTALTVRSPEVRLPPGTWVRVSGWALTDYVGGSNDGVLITDAVGGEPLALRLLGPTNEPRKDATKLLKKGWQPFHFYRQVPGTGVFQVQLIQTALGTVYFDDIRVEPLEQAAAARPAATPRP
jgi:hypothetical protein